MNNTSERPLVEWARRLQKSTPEPQALLRSMETYLLPLVRCALRSGTGQPVLVDWVKNQLPLFAPEAGPRSDTSGYAAPMARVLCERILERLDPRPQRETVLGP